MLTCSRHDIAEKLLSWHLTTNSNLTVFVFDGMRNGTHNLVIPVYLILWGIQILPKIVFKLNIYLVEITVIVVKCQLSNFSAISWREQVNMIRSALY
jgi:hypothetical protein